MNVTSDAISSLNIDQLEPIISGALTPRAEETNEPLMRALVSLAMDEELQDFMPDCGGYDGADWDSVMGGNGVGNTNWNLAFDAPQNFLEPNSIDNSLDNKLLTTASTNDTPRSSNSSSSSSSSSSGSNNVNILLPKTSKKVKKAKTNTAKRVQKSSSSSKSGTVVERNVDVRLKRNRESAKQYRIRKKAEVESLAETLAKLEQRNEDLRKQVAEAQAQRQMVNVQNIEEFNKRMDELGKLVDKNVSDEEILQQLYRLRIDYHARSARLNYHLEKIQKLMQPLPIEEVVVSCCYGSTNPSAYTLLQTLVSSLGLSGEKMKR
jgi:hypothetical protein